MFKYSSSYRYGAYCGYEIYRLFHSDFPVVLVLYGIRWYKSSPRSVLTPCKRNTRWHDWVWFSESICSLFSSIIVRLDDGITIEHRWITVGSIFVAMLSIFYFDSILEHQTTTCYHIPSYYTGLPLLLEYKVLMFIKWPQMRVVFVYIFLTNSNILVFYPKIFNYTYII